MIPPTEEDTTFRHRRIQGEVQDENAWVLRGWPAMRDFLERAGSAALCGRDSCRHRVRLRTPASTGSLTTETVEHFAERQGPEGSSRALGWDTPSRIFSRPLTFRLTPLAIWALAAARCGSIWKPRWPSSCSPTAPGPIARTRLIREVRPPFTMPSERRFRRHTR